MTVRTLDEIRANRPTIVTICGSTRFRAEMTVANRELTLAGHIVLAPGVFGHDGDEMTEQQKDDLDRLHLQKIDMADEVYVVNPGKYVGQSTRREIEYARRNGKRVTWLVAPPTTPEAGQ
jgi:dienelactone hydrolase